MRDNAALALVMALTLAGCATAPAPATPAAPSGPASSPDTDGLPAAENDTCGARLFAELIGKRIDGQGVPSETRLNRHILPNTQVTMDYVSQRTNFRADGAGIIREINCG